MFTKPWTSLTLAADLNADAMSVLDSLTPNMRQVKKNKKKHWLWNYIQVSHKVLEIKLLVDMAQSQ